MNKILRDGAGDVSQFRMASLVALTVWLANLRRVSEFSARLGREACLSVYLRFYLLVTSKAINQNGIILWVSVGGHSHN